MSYKTSTVYIGFLAVLCCIAAVQTPLFSVEYGHAKNFSWIQGKLVWNSVEGGHWQIYYMDLKDARIKKDTYRGYFTLGRPVQLKDFKNGEWVRITGRPRPDMASFYMTGTIYELKTVKRIGPLPQKPKLNKEEKALTIKAKKMRRSGNRYPEDFKPAQDLKETSDPKKKTRTLLIFPSYRDTIGNRQVFKPYIKEKIDEARKVIEKEITTTTGSYLGSARKNGSLRKPETIIKAETKDLYHLFTTSAVLKNGWQNSIKYVVFRPSFFKETPERHFSWLRSNGKGVVLGKEKVFQNKEIFREAGDLISYLVYNKGYLLERSVTETRSYNEWKGLFAHYIKGPTSKKDWEFKYLVISVNRISGNLTIQIQSYQ